MYIRFIKSVDGKAIDSDPYHEQPDRARALIAAGLAVEVPSQTFLHLNSANGLARMDEVDEKGNLVRSYRPDPNALWSIKPEERMSADWVKAPYILVGCTSCGRREVRQGPKAFEQKFKHCHYVSQPQVGNYVKWELAECPTAVVREYKRLYELWARENKSTASNFPPENIYAKIWSQQTDAQDRRVAAQLERQARFEQHDDTLDVGNPNKIEPPLDATDVATRSDRYLASRYPSPHSTVLGRRK